MEQNNRDALDRELTALHSARAPEGFSAGWREAVRREEPERMKKTHRFWRAALPMAAALVLVIGAIATGSMNLNGTKQEVGVNRAAAPRSAASNSSLTLDEAAYDMAADAATGSSSTSAAGSTADAVTAGARGTEQTGRKLVRTASLTLATTRFAQDGAAVRQLAESLGGYVESLDQYGDEKDGNRVLYYGLRVPSEKLDAFLAGAEGIGRVAARSESSLDKSTEYADTSLRLQTQRDKLARLQELMKQAESVTDLLEIESSIADTQYQIDSYESALRDIDRRVQDSAVSVTLREETPAQSAQAKELTLGERLASGLSASVQGLGEFFQNMLVFVTMCLPVLVPAALLALAVWLIARARKARKANKEEK
ncbi:MAG: DUF4349 domain-containing protein [Eubacteriales bacterium]|nr:DUF4349 domain-containing protein [Eubacteriales bacterium]